MLYLGFRSAIIVSGLNLYRVALIERPILIVLGGMFGIERHGIGDKLHIKDIEFEQLKVTIFNGISPRIVVQIQIPMQLPILAKHEFVSRDSGGDFRRRFIRTNNFWYLLIGGKRNDEHFTICGGAVIIITVATGTRFNVLPFTIRI